MQIDWTDEDQRTAFPSYDDDVRFKQSLGHCATLTDDYTLGYTDDGMVIQYIPSDSSNSSGQFFHWSIMLPEQPSSCNIKMQFASMDCHTWEFTYQVALYQWKSGWSVLKRFGDMDTTNTELLLSDVELLKGEQLLVGFTRNDFGTIFEHQICMKSLKIMHTAHSTLVHSPQNEAASFSGTVIAKYLKTKEDAREPVAIVPKDTLAACEWWGGVTDKSHIVLHVELSGTCATAIRRLDLQLCCVGNKTTFPHVFPICLEEDGDHGGKCLFSISASPIFSGVPSIEQISIFVKPVFSTKSEYECDVSIDTLRFTPNIMLSAENAMLTTHAAVAGVPFNDLDTHTGTLSKMQQKMERLEGTVGGIKQQKGPVGDTGKRGARGDRGEPMRFTDLTEANKTELRGLRGAVGPRGEGLAFDALTDEQKHELTGPVGPRGETGERGEQGTKGERGQAFLFKHFTNEQLELVRGERGVPGDRGACLTFEQLREAEKESLRGERGVRGETGVQGERGEVGRIGPTGPKGGDGKTGPRGLPGIPGTKGGAGSRGKAGIDGSDGQCASICGTFASIELMEEYLQKARQIQSNSYYIIDNEEGDEHGTLAAYTGCLTFDLLIGCTYVENLLPLFEKHKASIRARVLHSEDMWNVSVDISSDDEGVHALKHALESSIQQSGYEVHSSAVTTSAIRPVGKLCGQRGYQGAPGQTGSPGTSMMGLRLDYIGDEVARLKAKPENRAIFLQVTVSKTSEAGFYLYDSHANRWSLLHGVSIDDEFTKWMANFLENPHQDSVPIALSMFSTSQKHMDAQYNIIKHELSEYRTANDKWKAHQFEHWKTMGNSQYQQVIMQLNEQKQELENASLQLSHVSDNTIIKEEMNQLRKLYDAQYQKLETGFRAIKDKVSSSAAPDGQQPAVDRAEFDAEIEKTNTKLGEFDLSLVKMIKVMAFLKSSPWNKTTRSIRQDVDKMVMDQESRRAALEKDLASKIDTQAITMRDTAEDVHVMQTKHGQLCDAVTKQSEEFVQHVAKQKKQSQRFEYHIERDFPETVARWREDLDSAVSRDAVIQQKISDTHNKIDLHTEQNDKAASEKVHRLRLELTGALDKMRSTTQTQKERTEEIAPRFEKKLANQREEIEDAIEGASTEAASKLDKVKSELQLATDRASEIMPRAEKMIQSVSVDFSDKLTRLMHDGNARSDTLRSELMGAYTKENYLIRQEMLDADNDVRQSVSQQEQDIKSIQRAIEKQLQDVDLQTISHCKKNASQCSSYAKEVGGELKSRCDATDSRIGTNEKKVYELAAELSSFVERYKAQCATAEDQTSARFESSLAKMSQDTDRKVIKAAELMQGEWQTLEKKVAEQFVDINRFAAEIKNDLHVTDEKWASATDAQQAKAAAETAHQLSRLRAEMQKATHGAECKLGDCQAEWKDSAKQLSDNWQYENKQLAQRLADTEHKITTNIDHRITTTITNTDGKLRELDQRQSNAVQSANDDIHNIDNKCSTMEYMLKARLTSIEEHVQQLFADGQQMCESTVTKNKEEILRTFEKMRTDLMQYQKKTCQNMADQMLRNDEQATERQSKTMTELQAMHKQQRTMVERNAMFESRLLEKQKTDADVVAQFRKDYQHTVDTHRGIMRSNQGDIEGKLHKATSDLRNDALRAIDERAKRLEASQGESEKRIDKQLQAMSSSFAATTSALKRGIDEVLGIVKAASGRQAEYRQAHDERMRSIMAMTSSLHAELTAATN
jgi:hypothetical protein